MTNKNTKQENPLSLVITPRWLDKYQACSPGRTWALSLIGEGVALEKFLPLFNDPSWFFWTIKRGLNLSHSQYVELAVLSARLALVFFEKKYPNDKRPRKAIQAASKWVKAPTAADAAYAADAADAANAAKAAYAAYAADAAAYAADAAYAAKAAYAAYAADAAAYAAYAAANAAYAAANAAYAADAADAAAFKVKLCKLLAKKIISFFK